VPEWLGHARSGGFSTGDTLVVDHGDNYLCSSVVDAGDDNHRLSTSWEFPDEASSRPAVVVEGGEQDARQHCLLHLRHSADAGDP
jgi:hypothetical protein